MSNFRLLILVLGLTGTAAVVAAPITITFSSDLYVYTELAGLPESSNQTVTGSVTVDSDQVNFFAAAGVPQGNGDYFPTDVYGFSAAGLLNFQMNLGSASWSANDLIPGNFVPFGTASLLHIFGSLTSPQYITFFGESSDHIGVSWGNVGCCVAPNQLYVNSAVSFWGGLGYADGGASSVRASATTVPEPGTLALFGVGLVGVALARRRRVA